MRESPGNSTSTPRPRRRQRRSPEKFAETIVLDVRIREPEPYLKGRVRYKVLARMLK